MKKLMIAAALTMGSPAVMALTAAPSHAQTLQACEDEISPTDQGGEAHCDHVGDPNEGGHDGGSGTWNPNDPYQNPNWSGGCVPDQYGNCGVKLWIEPRRVEPGLQIV